MDEGLTRSAVTSVVQLKGNAMQFLKAPRDALIHPLQIVCGIVERRSTLPILSSVLVSTAGDQLHFRSTDLELELSATENIDSRQSDTALIVNARKLLDVVRAMPDAPISLALSGTRLIIQGPGSRISLHAGSAEDGVSGECRLSLVATVIAAARPATNVAGYPCRAYRGGQVYHLPSGRKVVGLGEHGRDD